MAKRYSGKAVITVLYQDRGDYKATVAIGKRNVWSGRIGAPASGFGRGIAYDSPTAYDRTASAALSFADDETGDVSDAASPDAQGSDWHIGRSLATKYPKQENPRRKARARRVANPAKKSTSIDAFTRAYIEAALFTSSDDDGRPLERNYSAKDILGATLAEMKRDCAAFQRENRHDLAEGTATQGGHDFWLTRNREGAGFWDGDWPEPAASNLTKSAHFYGSCDLYVSRGKIRH